MSTKTAKYILNRHGLACFSVRELYGLLDDRFMPLPLEVKMAIKTLASPGWYSASQPSYNRAY